MIFRIGFQNKNEWWKISGIQIKHVSLVSNNGLVSNNASNVNSLVLTNVPLLYNMVKLEETR